MRVRKEILFDESAMARAAASFSQMMKSIVVSVGFNEAASKRSAEIMGANIGKRVAMIFDGKLLSVLKIGAMKAGMRGDMAVLSGPSTATAFDEIMHALNAAK